MTHRKIIIFLVIFNFQFSIFNSTVFAQSPTGKGTPKTAKVTVSVTPQDSDTPSDSSVSATPADDVINKLKQIESLKEKIATKVAQLREQDKGAAVGTIKKIDKDRVTLSTRTDEKIFAFSDDVIVYKLTDGTKTTVNKSVLKSDDHIAVFGYYNEDKSLLSAKYVYVDVPLVRIVGKIVDVDKSNFTITLRGKEGNDLIDVESYTKTTAFTADRGKSKLGFSRLKIGDPIHVVAVQGKEKDRYIAMRILVIPGPITATPTPTAPKTPTVTEKPAD